MAESANLTDHFLIAMPSLKDPNFEQTVTYICEHTSEGAMGIVINRPLDINLGEVFQQMSIDSQNSTLKESAVFSGGPVNAERGFVLHSAQSRWHSTLNVTDQISVTTSRDVLEALAQGNGPAKCLVALGYAGWASGQLETELADNAWLSCPSQQRILFEVETAKRWAAAAGLMGVDLGLMSTEAGHA